MLHSTLPLTFLAAAALATAGSLSAQSQQLLGMTQNIPAVQQHDQGACQPTQLCPLPFAPAPFLAGASAWDGTNSWLWVTDGFNLGAVEENNCIPVCPPQPSILPAPTSGLAVFERAQLLYELDLAGNIAQYQLGCPLVPGPVCTINSLLNPAFQFTSLASDDARDLLFIGCTEPTSGANVIQIASLSNPCNPFAIFQMGACPTTTAPGFRLLTGLAADSCKQVLYATDGFTTQELVYNIPGPPPTIGFMLVNCCSLLPTLPTVPLDPYAGLAIKPLPARRVGQPCATGACLPCVPQIQELSDPVLGNPAYTVAMVNAPANATGWLGFNLGTCSAPGTPIPPFCAPILLPLTATFTLVGPVGTGGTPGNCDGTVSSTGPIPLNPALCGLQFSAQGIVFCANAAGTGTAVTSCMTTTFQGL